MDSVKTYSVNISQVLPEIEVKNPMEHHSWDQGRYTTYQIVITTDHPSFNLKSSSVRRRFSEVLWLRKVLKTIHKTIKIPQAPPRKITGERFDPAFIRGRQKAIAEFLNEIIKTETLLSDSAVHLFLQSDLTTKEIDNYFQGLVDQKVIDKLWEKGGLSHTPNRSSEQKPVSEPQQITKTQAQETSSSTYSASENDIHVANGSLKSSSSNSENAQSSNSYNSKSSSGTYDSVSSSLQNNHSSDASQEPVKFGLLPDGVLITTQAEINSFDSDSSASISGIV